MSENTYIFLGRVIPERALLDIGEVKMKVLASDEVPEGELFIEIIKSQVFVQFLGANKVQNVFTLRNYVEEAVRMLLDVTGYFYGYGYDVEIIQLVSPNTSEKQVFGIDIPVLEGICKEAGVAINDILAVMSKKEGYFLRHALADIREAMKSPKDTGFFCYRAIESLKNYCAKRNEVQPEKEKAWQYFRKKYAISKEQIMGIKDFADPIRHGNYIESRPIADKDRAKIFKNTYDIIDAFILKEKA